MSHLKGYCDGVPGLGHESPEEGVALVGAHQAVVLVVLDRRLYGGGRVLVGDEQLHPSELPVL